jgi:hypothetical protein
MLFQPRVLEAIRTGEVTLQFRRWLRPSVRPGGSVRTAMGVVQIGRLQKLAPDAVSEPDARAAGYATAAELLAELAAWADGDLYRIEVSYGGPDPRIALREEAALTPEALAQLLQKLARLDAASSRGPWTTAVLRLIADHPQVRAATLAQRFGQETAPFKLNVRKLKNLGLTESLEIGYRISPRGSRVLSALEEDGPRPEGA